MHRVGEVHLDRVAINRPNDFRLHAMVRGHVIDARHEEPALAIGKDRSDDDGTDHNQSAATMKPRKAGRHFRFERFIGHGGDWLAALGYCTNCPVNRIIERRLRLIAGRIGLH